MIKLSGLKLDEAFPPEALAGYAARSLGVERSAVRSVGILRRSLDARKRDRITYHYTLCVSMGADDEARAISLGLAEPYAPPAPYAFPPPASARRPRPVIVGMGPAGLFAALVLARAGAMPLVLERGKKTEERCADVDRFWRTGELDSGSNVQFGEGGAGAFSDGKLTTGISDPRINFVLGQLVRFGAPEEILYVNKPHIGTDRLRGVVMNIRAELLASGCDVRFGHFLRDVEISRGELTKMRVQSADGEYEEDVSSMILAPGGSARDTFEMLCRRGVLLTPKSFSVGVRIEHLQRDIDQAQYGAAARKTLPPSDYKFAVHLASGRSVYSFCVCPGGVVVAAASEEGGVVTNGMSEYLRDGENCNGGLMVGVTPSDFGPGPLGGVEFQRKLERAAFSCGGGYRAPAQLVGDFLAHRPSRGPGSVRPTYPPGVTFCNLWDVLPGFLCRAIYDALPEIDKKLRGFCRPDAVLTAVETRSSSPVRIERENFEAADVRGLFPCGEGAGYAGGIMSAAVDGIKCAEALYTRG